MAADDRRRHHRARIPGLQGTLATPGDVEILDLSISGLRMETVAPLSPGDRCFLELRHGQQRVSLEGQVRWASAYKVIRREGALCPVFRVGLAILDVAVGEGEGVGRWLVPEGAEPTH